MVMSEPPIPSPSEPVSTSERLRSLATRTAGFVSRNRKFYTVLILPHYATRFRKLHLSRGFVLTMVLLASVMILGGLASTHLAFRLQTQEMVLGLLQYENENLRQEKEKFEAALGEMAAQLDGVEARALQLAGELGLKDLPSAKMAAGGALEELSATPQRFWFDDELRALRSRTDTLDLSLGQIGDAFEQRARMLAATPSLMPAQGWFSHGYGWRNDPFSGEREFHRGVDIVAPVGTPIYAPADGVVSRAGRFGGYGKCVDLSHGHGYVTRYGHMSEIAVLPGARVRRGELIGRVGSTGRSTGPHLHYEVYVGGRVVNPVRFLGQSGRR